MIGTLFVVLVVGFIGLLLYVLICNPQYRRVEYPVRNKPDGPLGFDVIQDPYIDVKVCSSSDRAYISVPKKHLTVEMRKDGKSFTSVRAKNGDCIGWKFESAVILVPFPEDFRAWQAKIDDIVSRHSLAHTPGRVLPE